RDQTNRLGVIGLSYGGLRIKSQPPGALVKLADGPFLGFAPIETNYLRPGTRFRFDLALTNYASEPVEMIVPKQVTEEKVVPLRPLTGELVILSATPEATATIRSNVVNLYTEVKLPWTNAEVLPGEYVVDARDSLSFSRTQWMVSVLPNRREVREFI